MAKSGQVISQPVVYQKRVYFVGTADTFYRKGTGLCYNRDYGTATSSDGERDKRVEIPSTSNNRNFAGVLADDVTLPSTGKAWVKINEPGSVCEVAIAEDTVVNTGLLTCLAGGGDNAARFADVGFHGRGSIRPLETTTALLEDSRNSAYNAGNLATDGYTLTVSDSSDYTAGVDKVLILASEDEGSGKKAKVGIYDIKSITNNTTIVINDGSTSICTSTPNSALTVSFVVIDGDNDTCLAKLLDGPESGLIYYSSPPNAGGDSQTYIKAGFNYIQAADLSNDAEYELADGEYYGEKVGFQLKNAHNANDSIVDLVNSGLQDDNSSTLAEIQAIDAQDDGCTLVFELGKWYTDKLLGGASESS